jgi:hypothetical protein
MKASRLIIGMLALIIVSVWAVSTPSTALAEKEKVALVGPEVSACDGAASGKATISEKGSVKVKVKMKKGPPNSSYTVYWTCTEVAGGCHDQACGYISLGTLTTNEDGNGKLKATLSANPFAGKFVHLDLVGSGIYTARFDTVFLPGPAQAEADLAVGQGDPTE